MLLGKNLIIANMAEHFLLGIKKPSIKVHGSSDENALYYAVQQAKQIHKTKLYDIMIETMEKGEQK